MIDTIHYESSCARDAKLLAENLPKAMEKIRDYFNCHKIEMFGRLVTEHQRDVSYSIASASVRNSVLWGLMISLGVMSLVGYQWAIACLVLFAFVVGPLDAVLRAWLYVKRVGIDSKTQGTPVDPGGESGTKHRAFPISDKN